MATALQFAGAAEARSGHLAALLVRAEKIAASVMLGVHGRKRAGPGENFWQYRPYGFGDSTQRIDWHASAKSDRIYIRENEWEAANTLWLWVNRGPRMNFKSKTAEDSKYDRAMVLGLAMASLALRGHERVGLLGSSERPKLGRSSLASIAQHLVLADERPLPPKQLRQRHSAALIVSDFLDDLADIKAALLPLAAQGMRGHLVMLADPAEETLPWTGRVDFKGMDLPVNYLANKTESLRARYVDVYAAHVESLRQLASGLNFTFTRHRTDESLAPCLSILHDRLRD
ncbi:MAG: DUF58 domain-containing protein [Aestuariivirga sp.]